MGLTMIVLLIFCLLSTVHGGSSHDVGPTETPTVELNVTGSYTPEPSVFEDERKPGLVVNPERRASGIELKVPLRGDIFLGYILYVSEQIPTGKGLLSKYDGGSIWYTHARQSAIMLVILNSSELP